MKLLFEDCDYYRDFEACCDLPEWWNATDEDYYTYYIWFKAYDTTHHEDEHEERLHKSGYEFECCVFLAWQTGLMRDEIATFPARDKKDAERLLQLAADALYE